MKLMVCYDDSDGATAALKVAALRARAFNAKVYVVRSIKGGAEVPRVDFARAEKGLEQVKAQIETQGIECKTQGPMPGAYGEMIGCYQTGWLFVYRPGAAHPITNAMIAN
jgi:hypothetical protein